MKYFVEGPFSIFFFDILYSLVQYSQNGLEYLQSNNKELKNIWSVIPHFLVKNATLQNKKRHQSLGNLQCYKWPEAHQSSNPSVLVDW